MSDSDRIARVRGESLCVKVTPDEIAYRKKYLPDPNVLNNDLGKFICTVCNDSLVHIIKEGLDLYVHRVLQVLVCEKCYNFYGDGNFSVDEDGDDKYCRWCGQGGQLFMCSACTCAFCQKCIKDNLKASVLADLEKDDWKCLVCAPRPMFGCRAICWGAQELNKIAKENILEKKRKQQEWLESKYKEKLEKGKTGKISRKTVEDQPKGRKRRQYSTDSSSPEVMPAKKPRAGRANGRRRKTQESSSESESEKSSRRVKLRRRKLSRGTKEESSDSSGDRGRARCMKKAETSDDDSENEKPKSKKNVLKKKKDSSLSDSSDHKYKKSKTKKVSDNGSISAKKKNEKEKFKLITDSDASSKSEKSGKSNVVKKKVDMAIVWLQSAVKDIAELGLMIRQRSIKFENKKLNSECIQTYEDVLLVADKLKGMMNNIHLNYNHLETKLNGQLDGWKSHAGIGENKMEAMKIFTPKGSGDDSDADKGTSILVQASIERLAADQEENDAEMQSRGAEAKAVDSDNKSKVKSDSETEFETSAVKKDPKPAESDEGMQSPTKQLEGKTEPQAKSSIVTSTPIKSQRESPGKSKSSVFPSLLLKLFSSDEDEESFLAESFAEKMKEKWEDGPAQLSLVAPIFSDSSDSDGEQSNTVVTAKGSTSKITVNVDKQQITSLKSKLKQDNRSSGNHLICNSSLLEPSKKEIDISNLPEKRNVKERSDSKLAKFDSKLKLDENLEKVQPNIKSKDRDLESSSDEESESKYNMKHNNKRKCASNDDKHTNNSEAESSVQTIKTYSVENENQIEVTRMNSRLAYENDTKEKNNITKTAKSKHEGLESLSKNGSESIDDKKVKKESKSKAKTNESKIKNRRDRGKDAKARNGESEPSSDNECESAYLKKDKNKHHSKAKTNESESKKEKGYEKNAKSKRGESKSLSGEECERKYVEKQKNKSKLKEIANGSEIKNKRDQEINSKKGDLESSDEESESKFVNKDNNSSKSKVKANESEMKNKEVQEKNMRNREECESEDVMKDEKECNSKQKANDSELKKTTGQEIEAKNLKEDAESSAKESEGREAKQEKYKSKSKAKVNKSEMKNKTHSESVKRALETASCEESDSNDGKGEKTQGKTEIEGNKKSAKHTKSLKTGSSSKCQKDYPESKHGDICSADDEEGITSKEKSITFNEDDSIQISTHEENEEDLIELNSDEERESDKTKDDKAKQETDHKSTLDGDSESFKSLVVEKSPPIDLSSDESPTKPTKFVGFTSSDEEDDEETKEKDEENSAKRKTKSLKTKSVRNQKSKKNLLDSSGDESTIEEDLGSDRKSKSKKKDDDEDITLSSAASSDSEVIPIKKTRRTAPSDYDLLDEAENKLKKKRKRVRCADSSDESGSGKERSKKKATDGESPGKMGRKNIKKIKTKDDLAEATLEAAEEEKERRRRIEERQKLFSEVFEVKESQTVDKLVLDFDVEKKEELVSVHQDLVAKMKPHQAKGVKFMWDSCFESISQLKKKKGSGCILAHCMGLGKTFQVVSLIHSLITHEETGVRLVMVVCPLSTVLNWVNEFSKWLADIEGAEDDVEVFHLTKYLKNPDRARELRRWHLNGGVLVIGYEMFRNLSSEVAKKFRPKIRKDFQETLIDPGADLIVCDEGHMLKNEATALSKAMNRVKTLRRIVLTGTPMQNNLVEYHCMVQFVKPNLLGTKREFLNRFVNPITNGQFVDSTDRDVKVMKRRSHVLHKMLEGLVQRFDYNVLTPFLPPKHEYVINVCLSELQVKLYREYLDNHSQQANDKKAGSRLFQDWQAMGRVWTHPRVLKMSTDRANLLQEKKMLEMSDDEEGSLKDFIDDDSDTAESTPEESDDSGSGSSDGDKKKKKVSNNRGTRRTRAMAAKNLLDSEGEENAEPEVALEFDNGGQDRGWWSDLVEPEHLDDITLSGKLVLLFAILKECELLQDKVLVFSQSLFSLDLIEYFLDKIDAATQEDRVDPKLGGHQGNWSRGLDYFRLDGSTSSENRSIWCANFNREDNPRARLFLISTRAGGLGINLTAANRVIIFDASWNPSHDVQSIFRIYRFGQKKPCYVYRFIAHGTMEEKVYDRQVSKQSMSNRVVDEMQMHRHFSMNDLTELYSFTPPSDLASRPTPSLPTDRLLAELLREQGSWVEKYHEHDSLLENVVGEELNEEERKLAWEDYENDKKSINTNANTGVNPMTQQIEFIKQQILAKYPDKTEQEQQQILVYQVSLLMKQQQEQRMKQAQAQAQLQAQYQAQYQAQMAAAGVTMAGTRGQAPQMYPGAKPGQATAGQAQMQQPWQMQMQMQYMNQLRRQQQQQQLLRQQQQADHQRTQAIELMRMQQKLLAQNQENKGVVITELPDEPTNPET